MHTTIGISYGPHKAGGFCTVIVYGDQIVDKASKEIEEYIPAKQKDEPFTKNWEKFTQDIFTF